MAADLRRAAWDAFEAMPLPDMKQEEWRRTDIRLLPPRSLRPARRQHSSAAARRPSRSPAGRERSSGRAARPRWTAIPSHSRLEPRWRDRGVLFGSLDELVLEHGDLLRPHLSAAIVDPRADKFAALHAACWSGGTLLYVPAGRGDRRAAAHAFGPLARRRRSRPHAGRAGGRRRGHRCWPRPPAPTRRPPACTAGRSRSSSARAPGSATSTCRTGAPASGTSPTSGPWSTATPQLQWTIGALGSRLAKVNQHVALVGRRRRGPGQRRDVHRGQAAPLLPHAAAPPGAPSAPATCSTRGPCRTSRAWSGGA